MPVGRFWTYEERCNMARKSQDFMIPIPMVPAPPANADAACRMDFLSGSMGTHVEMHMTGPEAEILHRVWEGLRQGGVRVGPSGRIVQSRSDVFRYIFEQLEKATPIAKSTKPKATEKVSAKG